MGLYHHLLGTRCKPVLAGRAFVGESLGYAGPIETQWRKLCGIVIARSKIKEPLEGPAKSTFSYHPRKLNDYE